MISEQSILVYLEEVKDPEIPVLTIADLGVIRNVDIDGKNVHLKITPTYSGCPAMDMISVDIISVLQEKGFNATVELILSPAWTTDWITERGRKALEDYGVAAPMDESSDKLALMGASRIIKCTNCASDNTEMISQFGSTACKALFRCKDCLEPFDYFKCLK